MTTSLLAPKSLPDPHASRPQARRLTRDDLPALLELEARKWGPGQRASAGELLRRLAAHPELSLGAFSTCGQLLASLFMRPVDRHFWRDAATWRHCVESAAPRHGSSLFGVSLSSRHPHGVQALLAFFWPQALRGGWRHIYLGSPLPGLAQWRAGHGDPQVDEYVALRRGGAPLDAQLRYYHGRGFKTIVCVKPGYFPHEASLDYGVILRGTVPLSLWAPLWRALPLRLTQRITRRLAGLL